MISTYHVQQSLRSYAKFIHPMIQQAVESRNNPLVQIKSILMKHPPHPVTVLWSPNLHMPPPWPECRLPEELQPIEKMPLVYSNPLEREDGIDYSMIVWKPGADSKYHRHPGKHSFSSLVAGKLDWKIATAINLEDTGGFKFPDTMPIQYKNVPVIIKEAYQRDTVHYMHDHIGIHRILNLATDPTDVAVSFNLSIKDDVLPNPGPTQGKCTIDELDPVLLPLYNRPHLIKSLVDDVIRVNLINAVQNNHYEEAEWFASQIKRMEQHVDRV